ncbi:Quinol monooxygenase YgiN [Friedmanniella luteola]|uniref:Quinol monooxygenase YgiN n=1 Tax=Friedmanniella luteola TaxID=546871 RepID=A0A1H1R1V7_9ACTN|nr:antibiotic biosynthesis monooxygenase family protein [Friedmanniella luteola]SDS29662.1 Quinol monooxygenase YgiN [Friedmanniella luteola]
MSTLVHLDLQLDPTRLERGQQVLVETLAATRAWPGNDGLQVVVDDTDPAHLLVVEHWATTADHDAYAAWRATPEGASQLGAVVVSPPRKTVFSTTLPLPF